MKILFAAVFSFFNVQVNNFFKSRILGFIEECALF